MLKGQFLDKNAQKIIKIFNKPIEYAYHTLNFLTAYNLPIHYACKKDCLICQINEKIEPKKEILFNEIESRLNKKPFPQQKIEYTFIIGEIKNNKTDYYWLRLKPQQLLPIIDYIIDNELYHVCNAKDDTLFILQTNEHNNQINRFEKLNRKFIFNLQDFSKIANELSTINIYQSFNIITDDNQIKTAAYIYSKVIKEIINNRK